MLKLIKCTPKEKPPYVELHLKAMVNAIELSNADNSNRSHIQKVVNHGVRAIGLMRKDINDGMFHNEFINLIENIKYYISQLTPNELMQIFPIEKVYDGERWECKDYFYTISVLDCYGLNTPIGEHFDTILWDYTNRHLMDFYVANMGIMSRLYKEQTGKGIMETWADNNGISPMYLRTDKQSGKEYLYNKETGKSHAVRKPMPKGWKIIK